MPRGPAPSWTRRKEPVLDAHVLASINAGPMDAETGFWPEILYAGIETHDRAVEIKRGLYRSAKHLNVSMKADIESSGGGYQVRYRAISKKHARAHMVKTYGTDRSNWAYDPRQRNKK